MLPVILKFEQWNWGKFFAWELQNSSAKCCLYSVFLSCNLWLEKIFEREVNTLIKAFEVPPISKIGWDISQKLQVLGDLHLLLIVWLCDNYVKHLIAQRQQQKQRKLWNIFKVNSKDIRIKHVLNLGLVFLLLNLNRQLFAGLEWNIGFSKPKLKHLRYHLKVSIKCTKLSLVKLFCVLLVLS